MKALQSILFTTIAYKITVTGNGTFGQKVIACLKFLHADNSCKLSLCCHIIRLNGIHLSVPFWNNEFLLGMTKVKLKSLLLIESTNDEKF